MSITREMISVESLKDVSVLFDGDIYELARLLLKVHDAKDRGTNAISRHTVHGLATAYCNLANVAFEDIISIFKQHGLPLGATVEHAARIAESAPPNGGPAASVNDSNAPGGPPSVS
jgi:hypothetical protein